MTATYGAAYKRARARLLATRPRCTLRLRCSGALADTADHVPPISQHAHREGSGCCVLRPACRACQYAQGALLRQGRLDVREVPPPSRAW